MRRKNLTRIMAVCASVGSLVIVAGGACQWACQYNVAGMAYDAAGGTGWDWIKFDSGDCIYWAAYGEDDYGCYCGAHISLDSTRYSFGSSPCSSSNDPREATSFWGSTGGWTPSVQCYNYCHENGFGYPDCEPANLNCTNY